MALVQFLDERGRKSTTRRMFAPRKVSNVDAWLKAARQTIPEIPDPSRGDWVVCPPEVTLTTIRWVLCNSVGERCYVVIDRTQPGLGP